MIKTYPDRLTVAFEIFLLLLLIVVARLFFWQIIQGPTLKLQAREQHAKQSAVEPTRGTILTQDGYPLVLSIPTYSLTHYRPNVSQSASTIVDQVLPLLSFEIKDPAIATDAALTAAKQAELKNQTAAEMFDKLLNKNWEI